MVSLCIHRKERVKANHLFDDDGFMHYFTAKESVTGLWIHSSEVLVKIKVNIVFKYLLGNNYLWSSLDFQNTLYFFM